MKENQEKISQPEIEENVVRILEELPEGVKLIAAAKGRKPGEILEAVEAGVKIIGENYVGDARRAYTVVGKKAKWHFIGIPQRQKHGLLRRSVLAMFDMIETIDSAEMAEELNRKCVQIDKVMPVLVEVNIGKEPQKSGVSPEEAEGLIRTISRLQHVRVMGLMTMGPRFGNPEDSRPYFVKTRKIFREIKELGLPNVEMRYLSMGMTNSYKIAVEEGANIVRIGTKIFEKA